MKIVAVAAIAAALIAAPAAQASPFLTVSRAQSAYVQTRQNYVAWKMDDGGFADFDKGRIACKRVSRSAVDCKSTVDFYVAPDASVDWEYAFVGSERATLWLRMRLFVNVDHVSRVSVYSPRFDAGEGGFFENVPTVPTM